MTEEIKNEEEIIKNDEDESQEGVEEIRLTIMVELVSSDERVVST